MNLNAYVREITILTSEVGGTIAYDTSKDGWCTIMKVSASDTPEHLYSFFKSIALHFKALADDDF